MGRPEGVATLLDQRNSSQPPQLEVTAGKGGGPFGRPAGGALASEYLCPKSLTPSLLGTTFVWSACGRAGRGSKGMGNPSDSDFSSCGEGDEEEIGRERLAAWGLLGVSISVPAGPRGRRLGSGSGGNQD